MSAAAAGLNMPTLRAYADVARGYLTMGHTVPGWWMPGVTDPTSALKHSIRTVRTDPNAGTLGSVAIHVARMIGFVAAARSLDGTIPFEARGAVVEADCATFVAVAGCVDDDKIGSFQRGVEFTLDQWVARHDTAAMPVMGRQVTALNQVLQDIRTMRNAGKQPVVVFDLDGCLFRSGNRQATILRDVAHDLHLDGVMREMVRAYAAHPAQIGYSPLLELQTHHGITDTNVLGLFNLYFGDRFFTDLCRKDDAAPGGPEFVRAVMEAGGTVVYFTGRHETSDTRPELAGGMKRGTIQSMRRVGYPLPDDNRVFLLMKRLWEEYDFAFKEGSLRRIDDLGVIVAAFDNEPKAASMFYNRWAGGRASIFRVSRSRLPNPREVPTGALSSDGGMRAVRLQDLTPLHSDIIDIAISGFAKVLAV